jgi:hypothetical protein
VSISLEIDNSDARAVHNIVRVLIGFIAVAMCYRAIHPLMSGSIHGWHNSKSNTVDPTIHHRMFRRSKSKSMYASESSTLDNYHHDLMEMICACVSRAMSKTRQSSMTMRLLYEVRSVQCVPSLVIHWSSQCEGMRLARTQHS